MVKFYIPDFFMQTIFQQHFILTMKQQPEKFRDCEIGAVYGSFPGMIWNGGRVPPEAAVVQNRNMIYNVFEDFNGLDIPIRLTCTNSLITPQLCTDIYCNSILEVANELKINEVIVNSFELEDWIRNKYPNLKIISSTTKGIDNIEELNKEINNYYMTVINFKYNNDFNFLSQIQQPEKCEFLVNELCTPNCINRQLHYFLMDGLLLNQDMDVDNYLHILDCPHQNWQTINPMDNINNNPAAINVEDIYGKYTNMGFCNFKISGREITNHTFDTLLIYYLYYMVKPEYYLDILSEMLLNRP